MSAPYRAVIFDLDGTLLDTLDDLRNAVNEALSAFGHPLRTREEIRRFVGNGVRNLMERSLPEGHTSEQFDAAFAVFRAYYAEHNADCTAPYPGVETLLRTLNGRGVRCAVVSNKNDGNVKALCRRFFPDTVGLAVGERPGISRKPAPDTVNEVLERWSLRPDEALYVGDSEVDVATAANAGVACMCVLWGFRDEDELRAAGGSRFAKTAEELLKGIL